MMKLTRKQKKHFTVMWDVAFVSDEDFYSLSEEKRTLIEDTTVIGAVGFYLVYPIMVRKRKQEKLESRFCHSFDEALTDAQNWAFNEQEWEEKTNSFQKYFEQLRQS